MDHGDTAFVLLCSALVYLMTIPGLLFFNAGLRTYSRHQLVEQTMAVVLAMMTAWFLGGYRRVFGYDAIFTSIDSVAVEAPTIPGAAFSLFQMAFATITPCLFLPTMAGRGFSTRATMFFCLYWALGVYFVIANATWAVDGYFRVDGVLDFAGGLPVHTAAGATALALAVILPKTEAPVVDRFDLAVGGALLTVGWLGFNAGSAGAADAHAAVAALNSVAAIAGAASISFVLGKFDVEHSVTAVLAALVAVTPACGYVEPASAVAIGAIAHVVVLVLTKPIRRLVSDPGDVFLVHGVGGVVGSILTGVFATKAITGGDNPLGLIDGSTELFFDNLAATVVTFGWSGLATALLVTIWWTVGAYNPRGVAT